MKEIFISYSTLDTASAETVRNVLEKNGLSCWMAPRDIPGGSNYTKEIPLAIRNCKVFVLILSQNAQSSHWVLKELDSAVNCGKVILPFMLDDCILNDEFNFLLTGAQRYAAYQKKAEVMQSLIGRIRSILEVTDPNPAPQQAPQKQPSSPSPAYFGEVACSACGSVEVTPLPKRLKRQSPFEWLTVLLIPILAVVLAFTALFICVCIIPTASFGIMTIAAVIGLAGGAFAGNTISKTIVRRHRLRKGVHAVCYRCNRCSKVFLHTEPLNN